MENGAVLDGQGGSLPRNRSSQGPDELVPARRRGGLHGSQSAGLDHAAESGGLEAALLAEKRIHGAEEWFYANVVVNWGQAVA
jgi:hypothetical protein